MILHFDQMTWTSCRLGMNSYELILKDWNYPSSGFEYHTGYKSSNLIDIIHAVWYLYGVRYCIHLTAREMKLLDIVEREAKQAFAVFAKACTKE